MKNVPSGADFVRMLAGPLRRAAAVARDWEGRVENRPKSDELSPVKAALTVADTEAQEALLLPLHCAFPEVSLEAEEDTPTVALFAKGSDGLVVVDPIDGTLRHYLEGCGPYGTMIGLAARVGEGFQFVAALVAMPRDEIYFDGVLGAGARWSRGACMPVERVAAADGDLVYVSDSVPEASLERLRASGFVPVVACGGAISVAPLIPGVRAGLRVATTTSHGVSCRGRVGALISREAGAVIEREGGEPFPEDLYSPARGMVLAADPHDLPVLHEALDQADLEVS